MTRPRPSRRSTVATPDYLRLTPSGEIYLKSDQTRPRFLNALMRNLEIGLGVPGMTARVVQSGFHELRIETEELARAAEVGARTFGIRRVEAVHHLPASDLEELAEVVTNLNRSRVEGRTFAVRVRRSGKHGWRSHDAERLIGRLLLDHADAVNLDDPDVTVRVYVRGDIALVVHDAWDGPDGLPIGTQDRALVLLSGGIDSPVAAWMMMRRGCPVDMLHLKLDCAQSDHALAVGHELVERWGHGADVQFHVLDFQPAKEALRARLGPDLRQIVLKNLMVTAAGRLAQRQRIPMLVTGDSLGQVSSQTSAHLLVIDRFADRPILRPLLALSKDEIVHRAQRIGTYELSIRAREVCDLSGGKPVATSASAGQVQDAVRRVDPVVIEHALAGWETIPAREWGPGVPLQPAA